MTNPGPGEFRCGDCITVKHHRELVDIAVDTILAKILDYATTSSYDGREAIHAAVAWVRDPW